MERIPVHKENSGFFLRTQRKKNTVTRVLVPFVFCGLVYANAKTCLAIPDERQPAQVSTSVGRDSILKPVSREEAELAIILGRAWLLDNGEYLRVIDRNNPLDPSYVPPDLVEIPKNTKGPIPAEKAMTIRECIRPALEALFNFVNVKNGGRLMLCSGYRSPERQVEVFNEEVGKVLRNNPKLSRAQAEAYVRTWVARPFESEHGDCAVDVKSANHWRFADSPEARLLLDNAYKFGFDNTYKDTAESRQITGFRDEPWHWNFRGIPHAEILHKKNWVIQQYWVYLLQNGGITFESETGNRYMITCDAVNRRIKTYMLPVEP